LANNNTAKNPNHDQQALSLNPLPDKVDEKVPPVQAKTEAPIKEMKLEPSPAATSHETENSSLEPKSATLEVQQEAALTIEKSRESNQPQKVESAIEPREASPQIENKVVEPQKETIQALEKKPDMSEPLKSPADALEKQSLSSEEKTTTLAHKPFEELKNKKGIIENKLKNTVRTKTESIKIKKKYASTSSNWSVNLIAYKQQWYASSKANEFIEKGVPVEIIPVKVDNVTWFRLRVGGFVDREEASVYAGRIKKALNLSSVWVGNK
jgi:cell division septation protein DedD